MKREDWIGSLIAREDIHRIPKNRISGRPMERADENGLRKIVAEMAGGSGVCT